MPEHDHDSFYNMNRKGKIATIIGIALLIILVIGLVLGIYFVGLTGIFNLLGVEYESIWSLVLFTISFFILGTIVELFSKPVFKVLVQHLTGKMEVLWTIFTIEAVSNWIVLFTVDEFMQSITLSLETEIIVALLIAAVEIIFDKETD
ncbi:hypothetical protein KFZ56_18315 [Virgibacillus sp. NKC19-3]|uniref:YrvL family regulatory protein n=1 Tax=Virgibacillus saliphilus TaxID=2831674 RepID=UPI001C9A6912|nr:YrvL family regulatory protein [Virgibacillus sp. NKC19-3]MBY7144974.1 hypothetical protein [Virgibacillus sp. NKC19-3]